MPAPLVEASEAAERMRQGAVLLDVREPSELRIAAVADALHIPMRQVPARLAEIPRDRAVLVLCHHGGRSQQVADWLVSQGLTDIHNVAGGIDAWACDVDGTLARY